jgi:hypothetical protein
LLSLVFAGEAFLYHTEGVKLNWERAVCSIMISRTKNSEGSILFITLTLYCYKELTPLSQNIAVFLTDTALEKRGIALLRFWDA